MRGVYFHKLSKYCKSNILNIDISRITSIEKSKNIMTIELLDDDLNDNRGRFGLAFAGFLVYTFPRQSRLDADITRTEEFEFENNFECSGEYNNIVKKMKKYEIFVEELGKTIDKIPLD